MLLEEEQTASLLARSLLSYVSGKTNEQIISDRETYASEEVCKQMETAVSRIIAGEPLAYVLGEWSFYGLTFHIDKNVLIPRDDTCAVTQLAIKRGLYLEQDPRILDLCTGSGCIGIAVANRVKDARVTLADISEGALSVAKKNVDRHQLSGRVSCVRVDALAVPPEFLGKYDMIISNPPYITTQEMEELDRSVKDHEPHLALHGGEDGLDFTVPLQKITPPF
jgi:release factor glutamine methyltransferase